MKESILSIRKTVDAIILVQTVVAFTRSVGSITSESVALKIYSEGLLQLHHMKVWESQVFIPSNGTLDPRRKDPTELGVLYNFNVQVQF